MPEPKMTMDDYLQWESTQEQRYEFFDGETFLMTGTTKGHNRVMRNVSRLIEDHLDGTPCLVFTESVKVRLDRGFLYPDIVVSCEPSAAKDLFVIEPKLIIEVLSPTTENYDRGKKFAMYRTIATLQEYVLIDPDERSIENYGRNEHGQWLLTDQSGDASFGVNSIDVVLRAEAVFKGT